MKIFAALLIAATAAVPVVAVTPSIVAGGPTIVDGGFEQKGAATPVTRYCYDFGATGGGPACAASAWSGNGVIASGNTDWGGTTAPSGNYFAFIQSDGALSQTFTAATSGRFTVDWLDTNRSNNGGAQSYTVTLSDALISSRASGPVLLASTNLGTFTSSVGNFVARSTDSFVLVAGSQYTLSFTGLNSDDRTAFVDDVTLTAVPEPASWALMITGFGLIGFAARRRVSIAV